MSLNWKEIDLVLSELDIEGSQIQRIEQPSYDSIVLGLYGHGVETELLISVAQGACRIHRLERRPPKNERPLRFMECLRSRIRGGHIVSIEQLGDDRILRIDISVSRREDEGAAGSVQRTQVYRLYARLWSGAGNILLCEEDDTIIDAIARRPAKDELSGRRFDPTGGRKSAGDRPAKVFEVRDFPEPEGRAGASFNEKVAAWYAERGGELSRDKLLETARERFAKRKALLETRIAALESQARSFRDSERNRELGDLIMANLGLHPDGRHLSVEDFFRGGSVLVEVDPALSLPANAARYYERAKKEASGLSEVEQEIIRWRGELAAESTELARLEGLSDPLLIARGLEKGGTARESRERRYPGLSLERLGWTILVGRSAKENDELLRRNVRGSDLWLHARDWAGSYVFIKSRRDKSVPLEILIDAGTLALYYSKGREAGEGDLYYTFVKYLRRAKDGPKGLVIPTQEKNLHVKIDETRLRELRALIGAEQD
ncbi:MAG TPA: NFACT RNA binding domain-containing protein [Rectinemataceae bacterium]|nr:NFACT RNA binding domain-containing protein [Rectinemataceae bacterium]